MISSGLLWHWALTWCTYKQTKRSLQVSSGTGHLYAYNKYKNFKETIDLSKKKLEYPVTYKKYIYNIKC